MCPSSTVQKGAGMPVEERTDRLSGLTTREIQIARAVAEGRGNREIAAQLGITEQTVKNHLTSIFEKVGVASRLQLALAILRERGNNQV
jgi:two-component system, NarL family, nitrate/nitrite response regulator NarL